MSEPVYRCQCGAWRYEGNTCTICITKRYKEKVQPTNRYQIVIKKGV